MRFEVGSATDQGMVRETNQDRLLVHGNLVAVADGMGGHAGGELAAETAVDELRRLPTMTDTAQVVAGIHHANRKVLGAAERTGMTNMGTTLVAALMRPERRSVVIANVGDSRAYFMSGGDLDQITEDHSLVEDLIRAGKISEEEARDHPHRNVVTRVLGIGEDPEVDTFELAVGADDMFLLASDGLFNEVDHQVIATILDNVEDLDEAAARLVERANQNGGHDNITVVVVRIRDDEPMASTPARAEEIVDEQSLSHLPLQPSAEASGPDVDDPVEPEGPSDPPDQEVEAGSGATEVEAPVGSDPSTELEETLLGQPGEEGSGDLTTEELPPVRSRRPNRMRTFVFAVCVVAIIGLGIGGLVAYGRNAWFVSTVGNEVVIHQGRPGGVLFIEPQAVQPTGIDINDLNPGSRSRVTDVPVFGSLAEAEEFVDQLELSSLRTSE
ncbi:MAG: Stp1/IreP family PP2C-type Ser/Thr phosphatase [Acidimicrobiales bacterium]|nr:Stp1/IreP family PP2C-type Ser/Thr phosphatase [Acidimicrobiales bacterium]